MLDHNEIESLWKVVRKPGGATGTGVTVVSLRAEAKLKLAWFTWSIWKGLQDVQMQPTSHSTLLGATEFPSSGSWSTKCGVPNNQHEVPAKDNPKPSRVSKGLPWSEQDLFGLCHQRWPNGPTRLFSWSFYPTIWTHSKSTNVDSWECFLNTNLTRW